MVMSPRVMVRLDAEIGDEIEISSVGRLAIVGTVEQPSGLACDTAIVAPGSLGLAQGWMDTAVRVLVDLPDSVTGAELQQMVDEGERLVSPRRIPKPFESTAAGTPGVRWAYVTRAVALTVAGLLISAALVVAARPPLLSTVKLSARRAS